MSEASPVIPAKAGIQEKELPQGWERLAIEDIADVNPRVDKSKISDDLKVSFVPMPAVEAESGAIDVSEERPFAEIKKGFTPFIEGDVLFAKITPCMENGKMAVVPKVKNGYGFGSTEFHVLRPKDGIESKWIYYFVSSRTFRGIAQHHMCGAVGQKRVPTNYLKQHLIPVAPPEQQKRIVAKIEELFSHIDAGIEALKKAKQLLKQYRQSVLKAAVTGELTKEWREANKDKLESASQLLERILKERRQKWEEQQLEQFKAKGKMPKDYKWKGQYNEPAQDIEKFFDEPEGWAWTEIGTITDMLSGHAFKKAEYTKSGVRLFQIANVSFGYTKWDEIEHLPESYLEEWKNLKLEDGDVLMALNRPLLSKQLKIARLGKNDVPSILYQRVGKFQFYSDIVSDYFLLYMQSPYYINRLEEQLQGVNIPFINKGKLLGTPISITSCEEELELITDEANKRLDGISRLETEIEEQLIKAEKNKQSVLSSAFSGALN
ncbi:MAG: restriction endonuclease subunit S [Candidatus Thiodiazotropha sp.]